MKRRNQSTAETRRWAAGRGIFAFLGNRKPLRPSRLILCVCAVLCSVARAEDDDLQMGRRIQDLLHAHQADVFVCVQKEPKPPSGELLVRVFVGERGAQVARAEVLKNQSSSVTLGRCIDDQIRRWDVSSLKASEGDQLVFPLAFKPPSPHVRGAEVRALPIAAGKGSVKLLLDGTGAPIALDRLSA